MGVLEEWHPAKSRRRKMTGVERGMMPVIFSCAMVWSQSAG
jgi:hypothetical protein